MSVFLRTTFYHLRMRCGNALGILSVCNAPTFESLNLYRTFIFGIHKVQNVQVKSVGQGHRVKVNVTAAKCASVKDPFCGWPAFDGNAILLLDVFWSCAKMKLHCEEETVQFRHVQCQLSGEVQLSRQTIPTE